MRSLSVASALLVVVAGCNLAKKAGDADGGASAAGSASSGTTGTTGTMGSIADKALSLLSGGPFEGEITMAITEASKPPQTLSYVVKGQKMRFNMPAGLAHAPGGAGYVIWDNASKKATMVNDTQKTAMVMDLTTPMGAGIAAMANKNKPTSFEKTGKTDTVAGYSCEVVHFTEANGNKGDACVTKGITFPMIAASQGGWQSALGESFPLRAIVTDPAGAEKNRMLVTKVDKKSISDAELQVPAGYTTQSMDDMLKNMRGHH